MDKKQLEEVADILWTAESTKTPCAPIRTIIGEQNIEAAYAIQEIITSRKKELGSKVVGRKIGLTSFAVQKQLGVNQPDFGSLTDSTMVANKASVTLSDLMQPKIEAEIAFVLAKDITDVEPSIDAIKKSIAYAIPAIEVVGSRIQNWDIRIVDTIADNASASNFILGDKKIHLDHVDLINCKMNMKGSSGIVSEGVGSACLGNPLLAVQWLARTMIEFGTPLKAGEIILSGALGPVYNVDTPGDYMAQIEGLGLVEVSFH